VFKREQALFKVSMPLSIRSGRTARSKLERINLNHYHNWSPRVRNRIKQNYADLLYYKLREQGPIKKINDPVNIVLVLHYENKAKVDHSNILSMHEKFACDGIVRSQVLSDDNSKIIKSSTLIPGEIDRKDPRVDIFLFKFQGELIQ
jgi:hypothetical protein